MSKGQAAVSWTPENDAKLLLSIVSACETTLNYSKVAKEFGPDVPATCIQTRLYNLRKKAASLGMMSEESPAKSNKRPAGAQNASPIKKRKANNTGDDIEPDTPAKKAQVLPIGEAKPRASPRKAINKDYKKLCDPFGDDDTDDTKEQQIRVKGEDERENDIDDVDDDYINEEQKEKHENEEKMAPNLTEYSPINKEIKPFVKSEV